MNKYEVKLEINLGGNKLLENTEVISGTSVKIISDKLDYMKDKLINAKTEGIHYALTIRNMSGKLIYHSLHYYKYNTNSPEELVLVNNLKGGEC